MIMEIESVSVKAMNDVDTDYVGRRCTENGMMIVCADALQGSPEGVAKLAGQSILDGFDERKEITEEILLQYVQRGYAAVKAEYAEEAAAKIAITLLVVNNKNIGIVQKGSTQLFWIREGELYYRSISGEVSNDAKIQILDNHLQDDDALLLTTDGLWMPIREQEIVIDYVKSETAKQWISYLLTRMGLIMDEESDCYSAMAIMVHQSGS